MYKDRNGVFIGVVRVDVRQPNTRDSGLCSMLRYGSDIILNAEVIALTNITSSLYSIADSSNGIS